MKGERLVLMAIKAGVFNLSLDITNHLHADLEQAPTNDSIARTANTGLNAAAIFNYQLNGDGLLDGRFISNQTAAAAALGLTTQSATDDRTTAEYLITWRGVGPGDFLIEKLGVDQTIPTQTWQINGGDHAQVRIVITGSTIDFDAFDVGVGWVSLLQLTGQSPPANLKPIIFVSNDSVGQIKRVDNLLIDGAWSTWG